MRIDVPGLLFVRAREGVFVAEGTIKTITDRGFGFIRPQDGGDDVFFHRSALVGVAFEQLRQGDRVSFTSEADPRGKGPRAADVQLVEA
jgi:CspA family cold shock protein